MPIKQTLAQQMLTNIKNKSKPGKKITRHSTDLARHSSIDLNPKSPIRITSPYKV